MFATDEVASQIVGFQDIGTDAKKSPSLGFTFTPIAGGETIKLGTVKAKGIDYSSDFLQLLNPSTQVVDGMYTYYSAEMAEEEAEGDQEAYAELLELVGWWEFGHVDGGDQYRRDDVDVNVGQGFLGLSTFGSDIKFVCSGEAPTVPTQISTKGKKSPFIANYIPSDMYLKDITATGIDYSSDFLQLLNPSTQVVDGMYTYYSPEMAEEEAEGDQEAYEELLELVGWWEFGHVDGGDQYRRDTVIVKAGQAYLGMSTFGSNITFKFKSALDLTPIKK